MTTDRRIARWRLHSQGLAAPFADAEQVVRTLGAVQAENPSQSAWAVATRTAAPEAGDLGAALADGRVLRTHLLRSTWHYVSADDLPWMQELTSPRVRPVFEQQLRPIADRLPALVDAVQRVLAEASDGSSERAAHLTRPEIAAALAERGEPLDGQPLGLLMGRLEIDHLVTSGAPREGEHTYALVDDRVPRAAARDREAALAELAVRYFTAHGPATARDLAYWATLTVTDVRAGVAGAGDRIASFEHDGRTFWHAAEADVPATAAPPGHLLQVLDEMYRGYQDSRWVLDAAAVVPRDREAAIGMALVDGQLVAGMKRTLGKESVTFALRPYAELRPAQRRAIDDAAARYAAFLGREPKVVIKG